MLTSLFGQVLVEKLVRACDVDKIYLLLRYKKGQSASQRLTTLTSTTPFTFHENTQKNLHKLIPVDGNICASNLGLSTQDRLDIIENVSIVIHSAADVAFDNDFSLVFTLIVVTLFKPTFCLLVLFYRSKVYSNVEGIKNLLNLCHQIKNFDCLIHVSTAYSFCNHRTIDEKIYPLTFTFDEFKEAIK